MKRRDEDGRAAARSHPLLGVAVLMYFVIALEVLIMISPFAAFFYAVFNPVLLFLARWPESRWLAAFFLPHMVLPPGLFLKAIRVAGSVLFVGGTLIFLVCAGQVYSGKLFRRGPVSGGLYRWIRHPQYLALSLAGLGLAILWPRFLTIVLWTVMVGLYVLLARDEERRMVNAVRRPVPRIHGADREVPPARTRGLRPTIPPELAGARAGARFCTPRRRRRRRRIRPARLHGEARCRSGRVGGSRRSRSFRETGRCWSTAWRTCWSCPR